MVKLYYTPTSCGASSFISAFVSGLSIDCEVVDLATHKTESGVDFYSINSKLLLLKNYYELRESDAFASLITSFKEYIKKNKILFK